MALDVATGRMASKSKMQGGKCPVTGIEFYTTEPGLHAVVIGTKLHAVHPSAKTDKRVAHCGGCGELFLRTQARSSMVPRSRQVGLSNISSFCDRCFDQSFPLYYQCSLDKWPESGGRGRTIGIEVECEPTQMSQIKLASWGNEHDIHMIGSHRDDSLRGKQQVEYVSPVLFEDSYKEWLGQMCLMLTAGVYSRCGLHIHVGTDDFSWWHINRLCKYCFRYEKTFASMVPPHRRPKDGYAADGSPMSIPHTWCRDFYNKDQLLFAIYGTNTFTTRGGELKIKQRRANDQGKNPFPGPVNRYMWLNVHGHWHKRAIEVRLHHGTGQFTKISMWIQLWLAVLQYIKESNGYDSPLDIAPKAVSDYYKRRIEAFKEFDLQKAIKKDRLKKLRGKPRTRKKTTLDYDMMAAEELLRPAAQTRTRRLTNREIYTAWTQVQPVPAPAEEQVNF